VSRLPRLPLTALLVGATVLLAVYFVATAARYFVHNFQLHEQEQQVRADIAQLDRDHQQLIAVRDYLRSDEYVEDVARRTLGLVKPGETLVIVSGTSPTPAPTPTPAPWQTAEPQWWKQLFEPSGTPLPPPTAAPAGVATPERGAGPAR
jgi:cell division protein FtsB